MSKEEGNLSVAKKRLLNDFKHIKESQETENESILASPREDDIMTWDCIIFGPENSIWEGGCFKLTMNFTEEYPSKPPKVRMISKVDDELGLVEQAVNTIEERLEISKTDFNVLKEEITDDATRNDEQGEQESTTGVGEISSRE